MPIKFPDDMLKHRGRLTRGSGTFANLSGAARFLAAPTRGQWARRATRPVATKTFLTIVPDGPRDLGTHSTLTNLPTVLQPSGGERRTR